MADQETLSLLQEIRDLQKTHLDLYKQTVSNQQWVIRRQKIMLPVTFIFLFTFLFWMILSMVRH